MPRVTVGSVSSLFGYVFCDDMHNWLTEVWEPVYFFAHTKCRKMLSRGVGKSGTSGEQAWGMSFMETFV